MLSESAGNQPDQMGQHKNLGTRLTVSIQIQNQDADGNNQLQNFFPRSWLLCWNLAKAPGSGSLVEMEDAPTDWIVLAPDLLGRWARKRTTGQARCTIVWPRALLQESWLKKNTKIPLPDAARMQHPASHQARSKQEWNFVWCPNVHWF